MSASRLPTGGEIDRDRPLSFIFDGVTVTGFAGDTYASALLASGPQIVARSFKYRRPRGIWGFGTEEPSAIADVLVNGVLRVNQRLTTTPAEDGAELRSESFPKGAACDRSGILDCLHGFLPAGFYYKTFLWPRWSLFEPMIRAMAGIGSVRPALPGAPEADQVNAHCDALVIGAGPAGLSAALLLAEAGQRVILADDGATPGGSLLHRDAVIDGQQGRDWLTGTLARLAELGVTVLPRTTAFGIYDHGLVALHEAGTRDRLWRVRAGRVVLAAGAIERPLPFATNDLPGILSAQAALAYLRRHAILPGRRIVVAASNTTGPEVARAMAEAGAEVTLIAPDAQTFVPEGVNHRQSPVARAIGSRRVEAVVLQDGTTIPSDALLVSGGFSPTVHLYMQARGRLDWDPVRQVLVPGAEVAGLLPIGAAAGIFELGTLFATLPAALGIAASLPPVIPAPYAATPALPRADQPGRVWIDLQHDVTTKDVALAARENFISVEHLKRYTTLGMATDQGKTSNLNGLALMADLTGRTIPEVGTTTYRPPFAPVPFAALAGTRNGPRMNPLFLLPLDAAHRASGARFGEYGGWLRPFAYGAGEAAILSEARIARATVGIYDASPLGKIEVIGPDAALFLDFIFATRMSTLKPGRCRYGIILTETGVVYDDGVVLRLDETRFVVSCSSSHVVGVNALLQEWRQDRFSGAQVFIHDATAARATVTVTGPQARATLAAAGISADLNDAAFPHMTFCAARFDATALRIARISFTGDRSYEISAPAAEAEPLWQALTRAAEALGGGPIGLEAVQILRAEKGFIVIGKDTDGLTRPVDLGLAGPIKREDDFIGRRSLTLADPLRPDRPQLVGLIPADGGGLLPTGAHGVDQSGAKPRSIGFVTSSYPAVSTSEPTALALIERGRARIGETITLQHLGQRRHATIALACAFDPKGERLHA